MFKTYLNDTLGVSRRKCASMGILKGNNNIYSHNFADDQVVLAQDKEAANYIFPKLMWT